MIKMRAKIITVGLLGAAAIVPVDFARAAQVGQASWYSLPENVTANGEQMNPEELTAAHRSLPFGSWVLVENLSNGRSVVVRINDRGPFIGGRVIDLSKAAAASIGMVDAGVAKVRVTAEDGGVLVDLGEQAKAKDVSSDEWAATRAKDGTTLAAAGKAENALPESTAKQAEAEVEAKADVAPPKPPVNVAKTEAKAAPKAITQSKAASRPSKTKSVTATASASKKHEVVSKAVKVAAAKPPKAKGVSATAWVTTKPAGSQKTVKVAAAAKRSKPSESTNAHLHLAAVTNGIRAAGLRASGVTSRHITVASNTSHPYAVFGTPPRFMKPLPTRERRIG